MKFTSAVFAALMAGLVPAVAHSQSAAPPAVPTPAATPTVASQVPPSAYPAKIALIAFEQAVIATNEGQKLVIT